MVDSKSLDYEETVQELRAKILMEQQKNAKNRKKSIWSPTITDFRKAFNPIFQLSAACVEASFGLTYYGELRPFKNFETKPPVWWDGYNKVKHQFF